MSKEQLNLDGRPQGTSLPSPRISVHPSSSLRSDYCVIFWGDPSRSTRYEVRACECGRRAQSISAHMCQSDASELHYRAHAQCAAVSRVPIKGPSRSLLARAGGWLRKCASECLSCQPNETLERPAAVRRWLPSVPAAASVHSGIPREVISFQSRLISAPVLVADRQQPVRRRARGRRVLSGGDVVVLHLRQRLRRWRRQAHLPRARGEEVARSHQRCS